MPRARATGGAWRRVTECAIWHGRILHHHRRRRLCMAVGYCIRPTTFLYDYDWKGENPKEGGVN